MNRRNENVLDN